MLLSNLDGIKKKILRGKSVNRAKEGEPGSCHDMQKIPLEFRDGKKRHKRGTDKNLMYGNKERKDLM